ncbi:helix-turn-helix domain-containing protein [Agarilytica rhodophyticola]|uniref:helix-turn-helix domain-containing protein n=1 Tax=Agarilytica rhodophyticola TaxID=1737490 RepID=UPI000B34612B|nr:XRE family transcriptional regulator [Agarilytica rhodophyticola]
MKNSNQYLAQQLKAARQGKKWSLDKTAEATGVSKAMLGQIERGESSPTLATLWKIAGGFNSSISSFIEPPPVEARGVSFRHAADLQQQPGDDQVLVAPLFPFDQRFGFEMLELTLLPHYQRISEPHEPGVTEHVIVVEGEMELLLEDKWQPLAQGEAIRFAADQQHGYRNLNSRAAVFHNLIHYSR